MSRSVWRLSAFLLIATLASQGRLYAQNEIAKEAKKFLKIYCVRCHSGREANAGLQVLDRDSLKQVSDVYDKPFFDEKTPSESLIWKDVIDKKSMPPKGAEPTPSDPERQTIKRWLEAGAPLEADREVKFVAPEQVVTWIENDLHNLEDLDTKPFRRYFLFDNLNNDASVQIEDLRIHYAAVSKLINSLSWKPNIKIPQFLEGTSETVMYIDLRWYGWSPEKWELMIVGYPYAIRHTEDRAILKKEHDIQADTYSKQAYIRGDWFAATASRAPLYDQLIDLPETLLELEEKRLNVFLAKNFLAGDLSRAAMMTSKISRHNRLVERHDSRNGAYWRSYDFNSSDLRGSLVRFPLGPEFKGNPFNNYAFKHVGGEVIFHLPNNLMGYMLANGEDKRLDAPAPVSIVRDLQEIGGTPEVINGVSCMSCHKFGVVRFRDALRNFPAVHGDAKFQVQKLHSPPAVMNAWLDKDERRFMSAAEEATGELIRTKDEANRPLKDFAEPIGEASRLYLKDLSFEAAAAELGLPDVPTFKNKIMNDEDMIDLGLGVLLDEGALKRDVWGKLKGVPLFHSVIQEFNKSAYPIFPSLKK